MLGRTTPIPRQGSARSVAPEPPPPPEPLRAEADAARAAGRLEQQREEVRVLAVLRLGSAPDALHALAQ